MSVSSISRRPRQNFDTCDLVGAPVKTREHGLGIVRSVIPCDANIDDASSAKEGATAATPVVLLVELTESSTVVGSTSSGGNSTSSLTNTSGGNNNAIANVDNNSNANSMETTTTPTLDPSIKRTLMRVSVEDLLPSHPICAPGTPVLTTLGTGVLVSYRPQDDVHIVRLWRPRGAGSSLAYLRRECLVRPLPAAVGISVVSPAGNGVVVAFTAGRCAAEGSTGEAAGEGNSDDTFAIRLAGGGKTVLVYGQCLSSPVAKVCALLYEGNILVWYRSSSSLLVLLYAHGILFSSLKASSIDDMMHCFSTLEQVCVYFVVFSLHREVKHILQYSRVQYSTACSS